MWRHGDVIYFDVGIAACYGVAKTTQCMLGLVTVLAPACVSVPGATVV